jgi:hypothetical protein
VKIYEQKVVSPYEDLVDIKLCSTRKPTTKHHAGHTLLNHAQFPVKTPRRGVDMNNLERRRVLLADHGDHTLTRCKKIVSRIMGLGGTDHALAFQAEQDRLISARGDRNLVGA